MFTLSIKLSKVDKVLTFVCSGPDLLDCLINLNEDLEIFSFVFLFCGLLSDKPSEKALRTSKFCSFFSSFFMNLNFLAPLGTLAFVLLSVVVVSKPSKSILLVFFLLSTFEKLVLSILTYPLTLKRH